MPCFTSLTEDELLVVKAFDKYGELLMPEWALRDVFTSSYVYKLLTSLEKKKVIIKARPYRLSRLGKLIKKEKLIREHQLFEGESK